MAATLLQLVNRAQTEMGIAASSTVISNTTLSVIQQLNLLNALGNDLVSEYEWQGISKEYRFTTVFYTYTADTVVDSTTISVMSSTTGLTTNPTFFMVTGTGIPNDTYLVSVNAGASTAVLSRAATATGTTVSLTFSQTMYTMPSDYDRLIDRTQWDKSMFWELLGPGTAQQWQWLKSGYIAVGPRASFRVLADKFQIYPPLAANDYLGFEYVSNFWVATGSGVAPSKSSFTIDTDTCIFPDRLMINGLKSYFSGAVGMPQFAIYTQMYDRELSTAKSADAGNAILSMAPRPGSVLISMDNVQDSNYNL